jgi:hypothetical protein
MVLIILIVSVLIVGVLSMVVGRWMQRKGTEMEHHSRSHPEESGDDGPG